MRLERRDLKFAVQGSRGQAVCLKGPLRIADGRWEARLRYAGMLVSVVVDALPAEPREAIRLLAAQAEACIARLDDELDEAEAAAMLGQEVGA